MTTFSRTLLIAAVAALTPAPARACNIPVFRYAVDHWPSDPYRVTVYHRGELAAAHKAAVGVLEKNADAEVPAITLELVDLDKEPAGVKGVPLPPAGPTLPWVVVRYPAPTRIPEPVWAGTLTADVPAALLDSPARREIAKRIKANESAVWLLLTCGDAAKDDAAEKLLMAQVKRLEKELKLPKPTTSPEDQLDESRPLRLAFSVLRVGRNDPAEKMLVQMLLNTEDDLPGRPDPMVFAAFGRGRVLPALIGAGITPENIQEAAAFLAGPCSCQVKRDNPGVDLLVVADWGGPTRPAPAPAVTPIPAGTTIAIPPTPPQLPPVPTPQPPEGETAAAPSWPRRLLLAGIGVAGVLVVATGALVLRSRRR